MKLLLLLLAVFALTASGQIVNTKLLRVIDLTTQFARHSINITVENKGETAVNGYTLPLLNATNLGSVKVLAEDGTPLTVTAGASETTNGLTYTNYKVDVSLAPAKPTNLRITLVYVGSLPPYPHEIIQGQRQFVRYYDNAHFLSPYNTSQQRTNVKLATTTVENYFKQQPYKLVGDTLTQGPYFEAKPFSYVPLWIHFENNSPFLTVTREVREFEVSHWGNLAVEQWLDVRHSGAALKGQFSRFDFQRNPGATPSAVLQLTEILPFDAADVYYRDDIGNISTSSFSVSPKGLEFHIVPRFPLFGGWKNNWYTGYNLPLHQYLSTDGSSNYLLNVSFIPDFGNIYIEDYTVRIVLPEGARVTRVSVPFDVQTRSETHHTYLDTTGRPVVVITKNNVVPEHNVYFQVEYQFSALAKWFEPLLLAGAFFVLLSFVMIYVRFQLSIKPIDTGRAFQKREEIVVALKGLNARIDTELSKQNTIAERGETTFKWNDRPQVLDELARLVVQATPALTGESFSSRLKDYADAQANRFKYHGKLHAARLQSGKKGKGEQDKKLQQKLSAATDTVQQFVEDFITP